MFEKVKALCDSFLEKGIPGFDLMVCHKGECVLRYIGGYSDRHNKTPMKGDELYDIYSCSKPITCVAAMQLWEKGLFDLEDKLSDYMPEFAEMTVREEDGTVRPAKNPIRIKNLFEMTAGFNYNLQVPALQKLRADTQGRCPTREFARALASEPLDFEPGARYQYSLGHDVLAALVEVISGQEFSAYVKEHIFDPLGMTHSNFLLPLEDYRKVIPLYRGTGAEGEVIPHPLGNVPTYRIGIQHASGGAGCVSTVEDYMKFLEALRVGDKILKKETIRFMATNRLSEGQRGAFPLANYGYGLGMRVADEGSGHFDFGWGGAAGAYLAVDPVNDITLYYAQHVILSPVQAIRGKIYTQVLEELTGREAGQTGANEAELNKLTY